METGAFPFPPTAWTMERNARSANVDAQWTSRTRVARCAQAALGLDAIACNSPPAPEDVPRQAQKKGDE